MIENLGFKVISATNGIKALEQLNKHPETSLIFMDIHMPEMDGIETMKQIRKDEAFKNLPIIALTAHAILGEKEKLLATGMNDYLSKPICENELEKVLHKWANHSNSVTVIKSKNSINIKNPEYLEYIDIPCGIKLANNNKELAFDLLKMLVSELPSNKLDILNCFNKNNYKDLKDIIHKIHGSCCYCGVPKLKEAANNLESYLINSKDKELIKSSKLAELVKNFIFILEHVIIDFKKINNEFAA